MPATPYGAYYILITGAVILVILLVIGSGCLQGRTPSVTSAGSTPGEKLLPGHYSPGEITRLSTAAAETANISLAGIAAIPPEKRTVDNTLIAFDRVMTDYNDAVQPLIIMGYVYPDPAIAAEGIKAEESFKIVTASAYSRRDLYNVFKEQVPRTAEETRLYNVTIRKFEHNGLNLPEDRLSRVLSMKANLTGLEVHFQANLNSDNTTLEFTGEELNGLPPATLATFARTPQGTYIVTMKYPDYIAVMRYANSSETRKKMYAASLNVQAEENTPLLEQALDLRRQIARELGYATWADYRLDGRMAGNTATVMAFLNALKEPLKEKNQAETADLLVIKKSFDPAATTVDAWDVTYLEEIQKKRLYDYDEQEVREYFPVDNVLPKMFSLYSTLFGVRFEEVEGAPAWSPEVRLFRVSNLTSNATVGFLYLDLYPRDGKYNSFMDLPAIKGRQMNGTYSVPVVVVIGNCPAPSGGKPSLLTMYDVETLFHETGHSLHDLLATAPYGTLSGTNVEWDFVETPSQTMEEWVWDPQVMESLSGHYTDTTRKIPPELRDRVIAARNVGIGNQYSSQLMYSLEDMRFHTATGPVNVTLEWYRIYEEMKGRPALAGTHQPAGFSHLMGDYDAGYYSYLWSKVYALNIVETFKRDGMTNQTTGLKLRSDILAPGNMADGNVLLKNFLGRDPGVEALYLHMGIPVPAPEEKR